MTHRILIADDHAVVSWGLAAALQDLPGVEIVATVTNGIDAMAQIRKLRPDCAIVDHNMPGANGLEVFLECRRWAPETRFVMLTGSATGDLLRAFADAGVQGIALKDGTEGEIMAVVRAVLAGRTMLGDSARAMMGAAAERPEVTDRELAVLQAIARGHTNASAADHLGISPKTIDSHRTSLLRKFAVNSTASLVMAAVRAGLIDPGSIR